jgi:hypothetical protein
MREGSGMVMTPQQVESLTGNDMLKSITAKTIQGRTCLTRIVTINGTASLTKWKKDCKRIMADFLKSGVGPKRRTWGMVAVDNAKTGIASLLRFLIPWIDHLVLG